MKNILAILILLVGGFFLLSKYGENAALRSLPPNTLIIFSKSGCSHCHEAMTFIDKTVKKKYPHLKIQKMNVDDSANMSKLLFLIKKYNLNKEDVTTPVLMLNGEILVGWTKAHEKKLLSIVGTLSTKKDLTRR